MKPGGFHSGFTLVEGIITAAISGVIFSVILVVFGMSKKIVSDGALNTRMQANYEILVAQIGQKARSAVLIGEGNPCPTKAMEGDSAISTTIYMFDDANGQHQFAAYKIEGSSLYEMVSGNFIPFKVGPSEVKVSRSSAGFKIFNGRKGVALRLSVIDSIASDKKDTVMSRGETFLCRN